MDTDASTYTDAERNFLVSARVGRLATADASGAPHVIPICYAFVGERIVSAIDEKPKETTDLQRVRDVEANPRVALVVDRYSEDWDDLAWVQVRGRASVCDPGEGPHGQAASALRQKYEQYANHALAERPVIVIDPERVLSWGL